MDRKTHTFSSYNILTILNVNNWQLAPPIYVQIGKKKFLPVMNLLSPLDLIIYNTVHESSALKCSRNIETKICLFLTVFILTLLLALVFQSFDQS